MESNVFKLYIITFALLFCISTQSVAAKNKFHTQNRKIEFSHGNNIAASNKKYTNGNNFFWVAFSSPPKPEDRKLFNKSGVELLQCVERITGQCTYIAKLNKDVKFAIGKLESSTSFLGIVEISPLDKISPDIVDEKAFAQINTYDTVTATISAAIYFYEKLEEKTGLLLLNSYGITKIASFDSVINTFIVTASRSSLINITSEPVISKIRAVVINEPCMASARRVTNVYSLQTGHFIKVFQPTTAWLSNVSYTGDSIWVANQ